MPIYAFRCPQCNHQYETLVKRIDQSAPCPKCGQENVERLLTAPADYRPSSSNTSDIPPCSASGQCSSGQCPFA